MDITKETKNKILKVCGIAAAAVCIAALAYMGNSAKENEKEAAEAVETAAIAQETEADGEAASEETADGAAAAGESAAGETANGEAAAEETADNETAAAEEATADKKSEYADLAIADVRKYVNVRSGPNTDSKIIGKMYDGSVAHVLAKAGENDEWFQVVSGNVEGYIKAEFFIYGDAAAAVIDQYVKRYLVVNVTRLNVRKEPDISSKRIGYIDNGGRAVLLEWGDEWSKIQYAGEKEGYVASEYVTLEEEFIYAKSIEEERAELAAIKEQQARAKASEKAAPENTIVTTPPPQTNFADVSELRMAIVDYAKQFLGNKYVHGGRSLAGGTDCSGFTCYIYREFGYSLSRTPEGQHASAGRSIDISQIQPGDIICYSSNGSTCTHVGMYIGDGQIIHSANPRSGVVIGAYNYGDKIMSVRSIVD